MPFNDNLPAENTDPWYLPLKSAWDNLKAFVNGLEAALGGKANTVHTHAAMDVVSGTLSPARIPDLPQSKITGLDSALGGKADLVGGVIPSSQIPSIALTEYLGTVASVAAMLALSGQQGDWAIRSDSGTTWVITGDPTVLGGWTQIVAPGGAAPVLSVNSQTGAVVLSASDVGALSDSYTPPAPDWSNVQNKPVTFAPTIGSTSVTAVAGDDARLSDQRVPTANSVDDTKVADGALSFAKVSGLQPTLDTKVDSSSLGTAAAADITDFATAAQGAKADSALQPGVLAPVATSGQYADLTGSPSIPSTPEDIGAATAAQGALADTAVQMAAVAGLDDVGWGRAVFIPAGGTVPVGTPPFTIVIEQA